MKLKQVQSSQLKWDPTGHPLWFNGLEQDLYLVIGEYEVRHFEISFGEHLLSGGASKALQYGKIKSDGEKVGQDLSRTVDYQSYIPQEILDQANIVIESCEGLEPSIKGGLLKYLFGFSFGSNSLRFSEPLNSYVPIEKRRKYSKKVTFKSFIKSLGLPKHLRLKLVGFLVIIGIIIAYNSAVKSKGQEFLRMDERMNISYIDKYILNEGDIQVLDSYQKNILHRLANHMDHEKDEQFLAFKYLVLQKKMDPNQFDINGRTPLYYVIRNHLNPPASIRDEVYVRNGVTYRAVDEYLEKHFVLIENLLKMGLRSRLKKSDKDYSAWDIGKQDADLYELMEKYR